MHRKMFILTFVFLTMFACDEEEDIIETGCYLSEVTASNAETSKFVVKDGNLVQTAYGDNVTDIVFTFDDKERPIKMTTPDSETRYTYNDAGYMVLSETYSNDVLVTTSGYEYSTSGLPTRSLSVYNIGEEVETLVETVFEYANGNPVKNTGYIYRPNSADKGNPLITVIHYDNKKNPYTTLNKWAPLPMANNPIKYLYESDPESNTTVTYTYNAGGYPITYRRSHPNRTDGYADVTGEYRYTCDGG